MAVAGGILSVAWHVALRLGYGASVDWPTYLLVLGLMIVWFPAVIFMARPPHNTGTHGRWRVAVMCTCYGLANSFFLPSDPAFKAGVMASGHLIAFYSLAAAYLAES